MNITDPTSWILPASLPATLRTAAAAYAAAGIPVFPCAPGGKRPLTEHGFHDATDNLAQVASWWERFPDANIAIPTGHLVNVLDIDVHATGTGYPTLRGLHEEGLIRGWGQAVRSPSGGLHLYYPAAPDTPCASWSRGQAHIDFRGTGGYIIAPPSSVSIKQGQRRYEIIARGRNPRPFDANQIREFLTPRIEPRRAPIAALADSLEDSVERLARWVSGLAEGNRNAGLFWAACRFAEAGVSEEITTAMLEPAAASAGLREREIHTTIRSAHRSVQVTDDRERSHARFGVKASVSR